MSTGQNLSPEKVKAAPAKGPAVTPRSSEEEVASLHKEIAALNDTIEEYAAAEEDTAEAIGLYQEDNEELRSRNDTLFQKLKSERASSEKELRELRRELKEAKAESQRNASDFTHARDMNNVLKYLLKRQVQAAEEFDQVYQAIRKGTYINSQEDIDSEINALRSARSVSSALS